MKKISFLAGLQILVGIALYCLFSFVLFLGLQVKTALGNIGLLIVLPLIGLYIYWVCGKKRKTKAETTIKKYD